MLPERSGSMSCQNGLRNGVENEGMERKQQLTKVSSKDTTPLVLTCKCDQNTQHAYYLDQPAYIEQVVVVSKKCKILLEMDFWTASIVCFRDQGISLGQAERVEIYVQSNRVYIPRQYMLQVVYIKYKKNLVTDLRMISIGTTHIRT